MSMCLGICAIDDSSIEKLLRDPPLVWKVLAPDDPEMYGSSRGQSASWFSKFFGKAKSPTQQPEEIAPPESETDLDKAWHGIHYLLTKSAWEGEPPLNFLVLGGSPIGDIDVGYGPARAITSAGVQEIHAALSMISEDDLRSRFDPAEMTRLDVYPDIWDRDTAEDDTFGYCAEYFGTLKDFVASAADRNLGLLIYLS